MAATAQTLFIPFHGGLDTYSNAHLLPPGYLTASTGTMLDRAGSAYPGPGFVPAQWFPAASIDPTDPPTCINHGIGTLPAPPNGSAAQVALWTTITGPAGQPPSAPSIFPLGGLPAQRRTLEPWRQVTASFKSDVGVDTFPTNVVTPLGMTCPPVCAMGGGRAFYMWTFGTAGSTANTGICMAYQDLATRAWSGPYYLENGTFAWVTTYATAYVPTTITKIALACDGTFLRLGILLSATSLKIVSFMVSNLVSQPTVTTKSTVTDVDATGTGDESATGFAVISYVNSSTNTLNAVTFNSTTEAPISTVTNLITGIANPYTYPVTSAPIRVYDGNSTGFLFAAFNSAGHLVVRKTDTAVASVSLTTTVTPIPGTNVPRNMTITNVEGASTPTIYIALETAGSDTVQGQDYFYDPVYIGICVLAGTSVTYTAVATGWGGMQIFAKWSNWYDGTRINYVIPLRSGWAATGKTWGDAAAAGDATPAYPTCYLYSVTGDLLAKFGDADVGSDSLWALPGTNGYTGSANPALTAGFHYTMSTGQRTLSYAWPQLGFVQFYSARLLDAGAPIGGQCGLATVSWLATTAAEPIAQMLPFEGLLVIPGAITAYYDGSNLFEAGYFARCPTPIISSVGSGGKLTDATHYFYQAVMAYYDTAGNVHYSAPSLRVYGVTTASDDSFSISIPLWKQSLRGYAASPILFFLYRSVGEPGTAAGDDVEMFHIQTVVNDLTLTDFVVTTDGVIDATIEQFEPIYTYGMAFGASGGTASPPPFDSLTVWNNQVWGLANRNGPELWCTWPQDTSVQQREGPAWSPANRLALPAEIGQPKAMVGLDEKLLVFGTHSDYGFVGQAPSRGDSIIDDPGLFSAPLLLPTPGGIKTLNAITRLPQGVLFQGTQGFIILGRDLQYTYIGQSVNTFTSSNLYLPGVYLPEQQAVLLFSASDITKNLMFFYGQNEWAQFEQPPADPTNTAAASIITGAVRAVAGSTSTVYLMPGSGLYYTTLTPFSQYMSFRTPWIPVTDKAAIKSVANVTGNGILREIQVLGILPDGFPGNSALTLYTEYDFAGNTNQPPETQSYALLANTQSEAEYQWRFGFNQGNAARVRFTVTINGGVRTSYDSTEPTVLLTGMMLSYDVDTGLTRLGSGNSTGTP